MTVGARMASLGLDSARRSIRSAQRHYFSKRYSMAAHMQETEGTAAAMADSAAAAEVRPVGRRARPHHLPEYLKEFRLQV